MVSFIEADKLQRGIIVGFFCVPLTWMPAGTSDFFGVVIRAPLVAEDSQRRFVVCELSHIRSKLVVRNNLVVTDLGSVECA